MNKFEVGQLVFVAGQYGDDDAEQANIVSISPKGQSVTVAYPIGGRRRSFRHTEFHRLLTATEHAAREVRRAEARAVKAAEARLMGALREFGVAAWALAQPGGRLAPGNVNAIATATARVEALTASLREGRDA